MGPSQLSLPPLAQTSSYATGPIYVTEQYSYPGIHIFELRSKSATLPLVCRA